MWQPSALHGHYKRRGRKALGVCASLTPHRAGTRVTSTGETAADFDMTEISFLLNGAPVTVADQPPTRTLLDWLREEAGQGEVDAGAGI